MLRNSIIALSLFVAACNKPTIPAPRIEMNPPPAALMVEPQELQTIRKDEDADNRNN